MHITAPLIAIYAGLALSLPQFNNPGTVGSRNQVDGQDFSTIEGEQSQINTPQPHQNSAQRTTRKLLTGSGNDLYNAVQQWNSDSPSNKNKPSSRPYLNTVQQPTDFTPPTLGSVPRARNNKPFSRPYLNTVQQPTDFTPPTLGNVPGARKNKPSPRPPFNTVQKPSEFTPPTLGNDLGDDVSDDYGDGQRNLVNNGRNLQNGRDNSRRNGDNFQGTIYNNQQNSGERPSRINAEDPNTPGFSGSPTTGPNQQTEETQNGGDRTPVEIPAEPAPEAGSTQQNQKIPINLEQNFGDTRRIRGNNSPTDTGIDPSRQRGSQDQRSMEPKDPSKTYKSDEELYNDPALDKCSVCQSVRNKVDKDCYAKIGSSELLTSKFCDIELRSALSSCAEYCPGSKIAKSPKDKTDPRS